MLIYVVVELPHYGCHHGNHSAETHAIFTKIVTIATTFFPLFVHLKYWSSSTESLVNHQRQNRLDFGVCLRQKCLSKPTRKGCDRKCVSQCYVTASYSLWLVSSLNEGGTKTGTLQACSAAPLTPTNCPILRLLPSVCQAPPLPASPRRCPPRRSAPTLLRPRPSAPTSPTTPPGLSPLGKAPPP